MSPLAEWYAQEVSKHAAGTEAEGVRVDMWK